MILKEARSFGIKYCEENKCNYTYISHDNARKFYLTEKEDANTVFTVNKNGSLRAYIRTDYSANFHKELKRRKNVRRRDEKRKTAEMINMEETNNIDYEYNIDVERED